MLCSYKIEQNHIILVYKSHKSKKKCELQMCLENVLESLSTPMATFPEIFNRLLFRSIL